MDNDNILIDGLEYCNWNRELFEKAHYGGLTAIHATLVYWEDTNESFEKMDYWDDLIKTNSDILLHVEKSSDIIEAKKSNKIGIIYGFQNSAPIANDIFLVEKFFNRGLRFMQLTYNNQTPLAGGSYEKKDSGVSRFGEMVIEEMNRLGLIVDLSHAGRQTCLDAIEFSKKPVFKNKRQSYKYRKLTAYVKKVYPYANLASQKLNECEEKIKNNPEERKKAMRNAEKDLRKKYGKAMKRLTVTQGKILLLLIDRQTGFTTFELVQELRGDFSASMYQGLALLFGSTLKMNYDPRGEHWMIEDIVMKIEKGIL